VTDSPEERGLAAVGNYWLTYDRQGNLSAWDTSGNRVGLTHLNGAGTSFDSDFSLSYANGEVFIVDVAHGDWRGFDVGLNGSVPQPLSLVLLATCVAVVGVMFRRNLSPHP